MDLSIALCDPTHPSGFALVIFLSFTLSFSVTLPPQPLTMFHQKIQFWPLETHCLIVFFSFSLTLSIRPDLVLFSPHIFILPTLYCTLHCSTPPLVYTPLLLHFYCCRIPQGHLLHCFRFPPLTQSSSLPVACRSRRRNRERWELGRTAAWLTGRTWLTSWPGSRRAGRGGQFGHTGGTESGTGRTGWTWTLWTHSVCS